jgi:hypothetical protein
LRKLVLGMLLLASVTVFAIGIAGGTAVGGTNAIFVARDVASGKLLPQSIPINVTNRGVTTTVNRPVPFLSNGTIASIQEQLHINSANDRIDNADPSDTELIGATPSSANGCGARNSAGINTRVNQDCTFRRQAEEENSFNPADPSNILAGQNDSRVGFNQCGIDWSTDSGQHWGDLLPPFRQHINAPDQDGVNTIQGNAGTLHTYDAASDPATAFDNAGNGYFGCVIFDVFTNATGLFVTQSPAAAKGSFFFNVPSIGPRFIVVEDNSGPGFTSTVFHDKPFIAADTFASSPNKNNVYATWTVFFFDNRCGGSHPGGGYCQSPIFGSMSTDGAKHWSRPEEISGSSPTLCSFGNFFDQSLNPNKCNFDQGSDPVVLPNGKLLVPFNNGNTAAGNPNGQQLAVVCNPSGSSSAGTAHLNCGAPAKVGDDVVVHEPQCDFGRGPEECIPGAFIRTNDFPRSAVNTSNGDAYVTWQDYRNGEYDIQLAKSTDGGTTWTQVGTVNSDSGKDHYFPAVDVDETSGKAGVSYFRTGRVANENTTPAGGFTQAVGTMPSDYALSAGTTSPFSFVVVSPSFVPPDGAQGGFNGDYSGLIITPDGRAHPIWSDTRNAAVSGNGVVHDEDIFTDSLALP